MSEKGGYPPGQPQNEPPPAYPGAPGYPPQQHGVQPGQSSGHQYPGQQYPGHQYPGQQYPGQQYGAQPYAGPQYGMQQQSVNTVVVAQPGVQQAVTGYVPDNMGLAIFATICCFWPVGIVAIMRASEARTHLNRGDMQNALLASNQAKRMSMWAIGCGVLTLVVVICVVVGVVVSANNRLCYSSYNHYC